MIAAERRTLADAMDTLTPDQWAAPSLCDGWTVRDVAGHLISPFTVGIGRMMITIAKSRGSFDRANQRVALEEAKRPTSELAQILRDNAEHHFTPPTAGPEAPLTDALVHGQDFRRPVGIDYDAPLDRTRVTLDFLTGSRTVGFVPRGRLTGLRLKATDQAWSAGAGDLLEGSSIALALAATGRMSGVDQLSGDGVDLLRSRLR